MINFKSLKRILPEVTQAKLRMWVKDGVLTREETRIRIEATNGSTKEYLYNLDSVREVVSNITDRRKKDRSEYHKTEPKKIPTKEDLIKEAQFWENMKDMYIRSCNRDDETPLHVIY